MFPQFNSKFLALCLALIFPIAASANEPLWIDVRSATEYSQGHVEQALNIPYTEISEGIAELGTDKDAVIYLYCRSGRRRISSATGRLKGVLRVNIAAECVVLSLSR